MALPGLNCLGRANLKFRRLSWFKLALATAAAMAIGDFPKSFVVTARDWGRFSKRPSMKQRGQWQRQACASVDSIVKHARLPVWPAWFGIFYIALDIIGFVKLGAWLEDHWGGRVCPMIFRNTQKSDPFLLVAHHRHSFNAFDPFRYLFRLLLPEGFPAHPHRGFETVTYVLRGGLEHRDSMGVKKSYGAPKDSDGSGKDAAVQWMTAGQGLLHEEMWRTGQGMESSEQELFQIWVNLPSRHKMVLPRMQMLGLNPPGISTGTVNGRPLTEVNELGPVPCVEPVAGVIVRVIAGQVEGTASPVECYSELTMLHVTLDPGASWSWPRPAGWNCLLYTRTGEAVLGDGAVLPIHTTATFVHSSLPDEVKLAADASSSSGVDVLLLAGAPLGEPTIMAANIVMNTKSQISQSKRDLRDGLFGPTWQHTEDDLSWQALVRGHWKRLLG